MYALVGDVGRAYLESNKNSLKTCGHCQIVNFPTKKPFQSKIPIWINFGGPYLDWKMMIYLKAIWNVYRHLGYFMTNWYILGPFGTF
jgi:hypothetical protein